mmetsp:Transcript_25824/g.29536  ORF Transcript_25824/g.29536 Transcript_25824/m.29536 type:complete len:216 (+) Transcript_25824:141-788(+)
MYVPNIMMSLYTYYLIEIFLPKKPAFSIVAVLSLHSFPSTRIVPATIADIFCWKPSITSSTVVVRSTSILACSESLSLRNISHHHFLGMRAIVGTPSSNEAMISSPGGIFWSGSTSRQSQPTLYVPGRPVMDAGLALFVVVAEFVRAGAGAEETLSPSLSNFTFKSLTLTILGAEPCASSNCTCTRPLDVGFGRTVPVLPLRLSAFRLTSSTCFS